jgi:hypothetical protein
MAELKFGRHDTRYAGAVSEVVSGIHKVDLTG